MIIGSCSRYKILLNLILLLTDFACIHLIRNITQSHRLLQTIRLHFLHSDLNAAIGMKCRHLSHIHVLVSLHFIGRIRYRTQVWMQFWVGRLVLHLAFTYFIDLDLQIDETEGGFIRRT